MVGTRTARLLAVAIVWVVGAALVLPAHHSMVICRSGAIMPSVVRTGCCPPVEDEGTSSLPKLEQEGCCSLRTFHLAPAPVDRFTQAGAEPLVAVALPPSAAPLPPLRLPLDVRRSPPPDVGPPLIIAKRSLLL
jgi:hypothetical protein